MANFDPEPWESLLNSGEPQSGDVGVGLWSLSFIELLSRSLEVRPPPPRIHLSVSFSFSLVDPEPSAASAVMTFETREMESTEPSERSSARNMGTSLTSALPDLAMYNLAASLNLITLEVFEIPSSLGSTRGMGSGEVGLSLFMSLFESGISTSYSMTLNLSDSLSEDVSIP